MIREIQSEAMTTKIARAYQETIREKNIIIKTLRGDNRKLIEELIKQKAQITPG